MKTYTLILTILLSSFTILSCNNDDEAQQVQPDDHSIVGKWSLVQLTGGWNPREFNVGDIVWDFESDETMFIEIQEGVEPSPSDMFTPSAFGVNYTYFINDSEGILTLTSNDYPQNPIVIPFIVDSDTLYFQADESSDGMSYHFVKLPD